MSAPIGNQGVSAKQYATTGTPAIGTADGDVATLAGGEILVLQNLLAEPLYVRLGGTASATFFHYVVPACVADKDGTSPPFYIDNWIGTVSVCKSSSTASYVATKLSN